MLRQSKRKELRDIDKELRKIRKSKEYSRLKFYMQSLTKADFDVLHKGAFPDKKRQDEFNHYLDEFKMVASLENRQEFLLKPNHT